MRYLVEHTTNQYFISTHSAALMDTPEAEIYHITLQDGQSMVDRVTSDSGRANVCEDLGYHPSDLMQANSIVWVEGPSDRYYINHWIKGVGPELIEGIHYVIMFYGGRLASHLSFQATDGEVKEFISLRRLNNRAVMILDSDRTEEVAPINSTKLRLQREFDNGPGHAWITAGREIENYVPMNQIDAAIAAECKSAARTGKTGKFDKILELKKVDGENFPPPKVEIAKFVTSKYPPDYSIYDLRERVERLVEFIRTSNPKVQV